MRPYLAWLVSLTAALAASIHTAGVSAAFVGGRGPSMSFHPRSPSFQRPAPRPQMTPIAPFAGQRGLQEAQRERGRDDGRWWRFRSRRFAGVWPFGVWPYYSYGYGYGPYSYGYDPYSYGYDFYGNGNGYGFDTYGYGDGYGDDAYGYGDSGYDLPARAYGASGPSYSAQAYPIYSYRVAPSAKIIHLTPRQ
jgi:hypothetical protein